MTRNVLVPLQKRAIENRSCFNIGAIPSHLDVDQFVASVQPFLDDLTADLGVTDQKVFSKILWRYSVCGLPSGNEMLEHCYSCNSMQLFQVNNRCNLRFCPRCAKKRRNRLFKRYLPFFRNYPVTSLYDFYFLTISPENYDSYKEGVDDIRSSWRKFIRLVDIKDLIQGGIYVIEQKYVIKGDPYYRQDKHGRTFIAGYHNKTGWNIHIHAIIYSRRLPHSFHGHCKDCGQNLMKYDSIGKRFYCANRNCNSTNVTMKHKDTKLLRLWKSVASDRDVSIRVDKMRDKKGNVNVKYTVNYLLKYISMEKNDIADPEQWAQFIYHSRNKPLLSSFGCLNPSSTDCPLNKKNPQYLDFKKLMDLRRYCEFCKEKDVHYSLLSPREAHPPLEEVYVQMENLMCYVDDAEHHIIERMKKGFEDRLEILSDVPDVDWIRYNGKFWDMVRRGDIYEYKLDLYRPVV
jgi:hypothetical protein